MVKELIARLSALDGPHGFTGKELYDICRKQLGSDEALGLSKVLKKALNGSIDAAISLSKSVLPGRRVDATLEEDGTGYGCIWLKQNTRSARAANPAIALVIAILKAKETGQS